MKDEVTRTLKDEQSKILGVRHVSLMMQHAAADGINAALTLLPELLPVNQKTSTFALNQHVFVGEAKL